MAFGRRQRLKPCPYCGWEIRAEAVKCRYCENFLGDAPEGKETCRLCRVVAGISVLVLLAGVVVLLLKTGFP